MYLITRSTTKNDSDVSQDIVTQFENAIYAREKQNVRPIVNNNKYLSLILKWVILKFPFPFAGWMNKTLDTTLCIHMGPDYGKSARYYLQSRKKIAYFFDVWPYTFERKKTYLSKLKLDFVFLSSLQATTYFKSQGFSNVFWIPEGIDPFEYKFLPYDDKDIHVLELGRKYLKLHEQIRPVLAANHFNHLYEQQSGKIIFSDHDSFINGLARTRISICYPRSTTHPESAGNISTLTNRYLQSMASKCLIVGESPAEMQHLFDYDPVINIDLNNAETEIIRILDNFETYIPLIEKNYQTVVNSHKWADRWISMKRIVNG